MLGKKLKSNKLLAIFMIVTLIFNSVSLSSIVLADENEISVSDENSLTAEENILSNRMVNKEFEYLDYFDKNLVQRYSSSDNEKQAAEYIKSELESFGYEANLSKFNFTLKSKKYNSQNVIATKKGLSSDRQIIIGAHYDSVQNTNGIADNACGVALVLSYAKELVNLNPRYDVKIVFFGSEELGMQGSNAYVKNMSKEEKQKTIMMINADGIMAGTYCYVYGGQENKKGEIQDDWGAYLAKDIADSMNLDLRLNDTSISTCKTPTVPDRSDNVPFKNAGIPYVYFEAANWELPDNPNKPNLGSTGIYETEIGKFMHEPEKDNLTTILQNFGEKPKNNMRLYSTVLPKLVDRAMSREYMSDFITLGDTNDETAKSIDAELAYLDYFDRNLIQRYSSSQNEKNAGEYLKKELESFGYEVQEEPFEFDLKEQHYASQNIVTCKNGISSERQIILGAHYDSVQDTSGIEDNASGVALLLAYAEKLSKLQPQYDIKIAFFGSEELGMQGSKAYLNNMSKEDKEKTIVMINADCLIAGTYCYVYSGREDSNGEIKEAWGAELAKNIATDMSLDLRLNDTSISTCKVPTVDDRSDNAPFKSVGIPYVFFESTNWEVPDDPQNPDNGSTGKYETEIGRFMHEPERDNLSSIMQAFNDRARSNLYTYTSVLPVLVEKSMEKAANGELPLNTIIENNGNGCSFGINIPQLSVNMIFAIAGAFIILILGIWLVITTIKRRKYNRSMKVIRRR